MIEVATYTAELSKSSHTKLDKFLDMLRVLYNAALEERIGAYKKVGKSIGCFAQMRSLTEIRQSDLGYEKYMCSIQQNILKQLDKSYQRFFKNGGGFPRFKSYHRGIRSFEWHNPNIKTHGKSNFLKVKGVGNLKFKGALPDKIKLVRVVKTARRIKIQLVHETPCPLPVPSINPLGIDVGIKSRITCSNGYQTEKNELDRREIKRKQRILSKAVKGSNNRKKKRTSLRKEWERVRDKERGKLHELTAKLVKQSNMFFIEDLQVLNMVKNHNLARSILEANWGTFAQMLTYKAEKAGGKVIKVAPHGTSQICSDCGAKPKEKLTLAVRWYRCESCGFEADRDLNASKNVLQRGLNPSLSGGYSEFTLSPIHRENEKIGSQVAGSYCVEKVR